MRAFILAAGRGNRLRPLTDTTPKPLLPVAGGVRLIDWQLAALARAGIRDVVVNTGHLADAFETLPGQLAPRGFRLRISREGSCVEEALETLGGIVHALPLLAPEDDPALADEPFIVLAGDVVHDFDLLRLRPRARAIRAGEVDVHLVAVPNPDFHPAGDMTVHPDGSVTPGPGPHTYGCIMICAPRIFRGLPDRSARLFPWLWQFARSGRMSAEVFTGFWKNVGTPAEYERLRSNPAALALARY